MSENHNPRTVYIVMMYVTLGQKRINALLESLGKLVYRSSYENGRCEITAQRKDAPKIVKAILKFFDDNELSKHTKDGLSRFLFPFSHILTKRFAKKFGLQATPIGFVFKQCVEKTLESLKPKLPEEQIAFKTWDEKITKILTAFTEKKQMPLRKWLEMTEPNLKTNGI